MAAITFPVAGAHADVVTVFGGTGAPTANDWGFYTSENSSTYQGSPVVGSTVITDTAPRSGTGSVELSGDRTRFQIGNQYTVPALGLTPSNLGQLSTVLGLTFDWRIAGDSSNPYNVDYTPALRLLVQDGNTRSELIWEGAYNGTYGNTARDTWYTSLTSDNFHQFKGGDTLVNGQLVNKTLRSWITDNYSTNAFVSAISVGDGSGASPGYHAFADNVTLSLVNGTSTTYNFEVAAAAVPEPASMALLLGGVGMAGLIRRRTR